jgi:hypothetical protein
MPRQASCLGILQPLSRALSELLTISRSLILPRGRLTREQALRIRVCNSRLIRLLRMLRRGLSLKAREGGK